MIMEKGGGLLKRSLENSKEQMSSEELAKNYYISGTALSLPCDFFS